MIKNLFPEPPKENRSSENEVRHKQSVTEDELPFLNSRSAAVLEETAWHSRVFLWILFSTIVLAVFWMEMTMIDEVVKGGGNIVPSSRIKSIQNLEGGIVKEILVKEGDSVKKGQPLLKIEDIFFSSSYEKNRLKYDELYAKMLRLRAEAFSKPFSVPEKMDSDLSSLVEKERNLYESNLQQLNKSLAGVRARITQYREKLAQLKEHSQELKEEMEIVQKRIDINTPLVERKIVSEVEFLKLQQEQNNVQQVLTKTRHDVEATKAVIEEAENMLDETRLAFENKAKVELNSIEAELRRIKESQLALKDQVTRTLVRSPVEGIVKNMYVNTIGGVVQPGREIMDILPTGETLLVEVKVHPKDIAFIYPDQRAVVKVTAYDFSIYGGLNGKVVRISPDSTTEADGRTYYKVWIETDRNYLGTKESPLKLIPGMVVYSDIVTGKKSILDYMLRPLLKTTENAFKER
jgi:adhesin transport system membrane fusion protein